LSRPCRASDFVAELVSCGPDHGRSLIFMARPAAHPPEEKVRIVLSILAGEVTVAEAARRAKVSEQSVGNWKRQFLESGRAGLASGKSGPSSREQQLEAEVADLTQALGEPAVELRV
jgi:transposase